MPGLHHVVEIYVTKYALTVGILKCTAETFDDNPDMAVVKADPAKGTCDAYYHKPDWYLTRKEAVARAEIMREKKIRSMEKNLEKLREMKIGQLPV